MATIAEHKEKQKYINKARATEELYNIPSNTLVGLLAQESGFSDDVITGKRKSYAGAIGIAQFMPGTAKEYGIDPLDTDQAIDAAGKYLASSYKTFGNWDDAILSYNAGVGRVKQYKAGKPIKIKEHAEYVDRVKGRIAQYSGIPTTNINNFEGKEESTTFVPPILAGVPYMESKEEEKTTKDKDVEEVEKQTAEYNFLQEMQNNPQREVLAQQEQQPQQRQQIQRPNYIQQYEQVSQFVDTPIAQQGGNYTEAELAFLSEIAVKDNKGYWNPNNAGKVVEIDSNHITMKGVQKPIKAVSKQTGEEKILYPDKDYVFENTSQVIEMPIAQYGGHVLRFQGGGVKTPIYKNLEDFYNQNKEVTTYNSDDKSTLPLLTSYNKYDDSLEYEYCTDIDCMTKANRVIDAFANRNSFFEDTFNKTKPNIGANLSTKTKPTPQEAEQNPYFKEDEEFGSLDSWDVAKQYEKTSPKSIVFSSSGNKKNNINYSQLEQKYKDKIAVGSFIGLGNHDFKDGEQRANHTVRVTGFLSDGEPLVADYGKIVPLSRAMYIEGDKSQNTIAHILNIPGKEKYTFNHFNDIEKAKNVKTGKKYINNLNSLPVIEDGKVGYKKPSEDYVKYHNVIGDEKTYITKALGINDETYDRYAKIALTLGANETKYGTSKVYKYLNSFKDSKGVAQLREENVSDRYKETLSKYKKDSPEYNAVATMLYIKELDKYKDKWLDKGKNNTERVFKRQDEETIKNTVRNFQGKKQMGYLNSDFGNDIFRDGDIEFEMPYKQPWQSEEDYKKEVDQELRDKKLSDIYSFKINNGKREIVKKTKGTTIPNTLEDLVFYAWQSPTTVVSGDAQGDSNYYKKNKQYYNLLFPK